MSLLTASFIKKSHILARIYIIFLDKSPERNFKVFQYQIWTSMKRLEEYLSRKTNFGTFLLLSYSNFEDKNCGQNCAKSFRITKIVEQIEL